MDKRTQIRFEKCLKDFECEESFKRNLDYPYDSYIKDINAPNAIGSGFSWYYSPEGSIYWENINRLWIQNYEKSQESEHAGAKSCDADKKDVTERIKIFEDAYNELGINHKFVEDYSRCAYSVSKDIEAYLKLRIVCAALNEGWEPQSTENEIRWYPWFYFCTEDNANGLTGLEYARSDRTPLGVAADVGFRICLKNEELAEYCGKQFIELWSDFYMK